MLGTRLEALGWDERCARAFAPWAGRPEVFPGRVAIEFNYIYRVLTADGEIEGTATGRLKHRAASRSELPAVGDWVVVRKRPHHDRAAIQAVLPRHGKFSRKVAGQTTDEQVVAANVDVVFLVMALDQDFSLRRLERYMLLARESGAAPVIVLTKPDMCDDVPTRVAEVSALAGNLAAHVVNPTRNQGLDQLAVYLSPGRTAALLGSSGVGKSTIINRLAGTDLQKTREVREADAKGRHTTTHRELIVLPSGGLIIDTPGMRELQLWDVGEAVRQTFDDVEALAAACYFSDCRHREEPRCAVKAAVAEGRVPAARLQSYLKLRDELADLGSRQNARRRRAKVISKTLEARQKRKGRGS